METYGTTVAVSQNYLGITVGELHAYHTVFVTNDNRLLSFNIYSGIFAQRSLFHHATFGGKYKVMRAYEFLILEILARDESRNGIAVLYIKKILDSASLGIFSTLREFVNLHFVDDTTLCKEQK